MNIIILLSYMGLLLILSSIPDTREAAHLLALVSPKVQNLLHIPAYGLLALLWIHTLRAYGVAERWSICVSLFLATGYGIFTELVQVWVPGRFPSVWDLMLDLVGILLAIRIYRQIPESLPPELET